MKVSFITLGCKVNTYETNAIMELFKNNNHEIVNDDEYFDACIINTCSVTNTASAKSRKMIRGAINQNPNAIIGVMGCYSESNSDDIAKISGVDYIIGNENKKNIVELIEQGVKRNEALVQLTNILNYKTFEDFSATSFNQTRAFLKIQDGCNNFCTYCIIPYTRGPIRSKNADSVIEDMKNILDKGYKEIVLTGIHTGKYNDTNTSFTQLCERILSETTVQRLRLSSIEINEITKGFLELFKTNRLAKHLHLPLQSGCDKTLKMMNRKYKTKEFLEQINLIRSYVPDIAITTDVIVGFPEETDEDFNNTLKFIKQVGFAKMHIFPFSLRKNTKAELLKPVDGIVIKQRVKELSNLDYDMQLEYNSKFINQSLDIIVEDRHGDYLVGHTSNFLLVHIPFEEGLLKEVINVEITSIKNNKLYAKRIK